MMYLFSFKVLHYKDAGILKFLQRQKKEFVDHYFASKYLLKNISI